MKSLVRNHKCVVSILLALLIVFGAINIVYAQGTFVTNFGQPYRWENQLGNNDFLLLPYAIWVDGGLAQKFRTGSRQYGYQMSSVTFLVRPSADPIGYPSSVSLWSSSNGVPGTLLYPLIKRRGQDDFLGWPVTFQATTHAILEPNTDYFIVIRSSIDQSRVEITPSEHEDSGALSGWSIGNNLLTKSGDTWRSVTPEDAGRKIFPADKSPILRTKLEGIVLNSQTIIISLTQVSEGEFKATATASSPSDIVLPITVINGTIADGSTTVTIPAGSTESNVINVSRTPGTTFPVIVDIGNLPSPPAGYNLYKTPSRLPIQVLDVLQGEITPVSQRTPQVRDAIVAAAGVSSANYVTETHLAAITTLSVNHPQGQPSRTINFQIDESQQSTRV